MADTPTHEALRQCRDALHKAEAALADIVAGLALCAADVAWCEARAAEDLPMVRAALAAADAALSVQAEPVATVTECEACFTPDVCQLRGTCDHYAAERLRVAATPQPPAPVPAPSVGAEGLPEIDYHALIIAAFARTKARQGTPRCATFKAGAEWYREQALAALASRPAVDADKRDAERYRFLRENGDRGCTEKDGYGGQTLMMGDALDAAIDAAHHAAQREGE